MKYLITLLILLSVTGCRESEYIYTKEIILNRASDFSIESTGGNAEGPYKLVQGPTGHHDGAIGYTFKTAAGEFLVSHPAIPGYYMQIDGYVNDTGELFWVIKKRPNKTIEEQPIQPPRN